jgi:2,3-bisphosphoglycerate-dependent phosphoglycerate mutase
MEHMKKLIYLSSIILLIASLQACGKKEADTTTVWLVRHAEKDMNDSTSNPPLTSQGKYRADKLAAIMANKELTAIFTTGLTRTISTISPTASMQGMDIKYYEYRSPEPMLNGIKAGEHGKTILICGHGDNILPMIEYLGAVKPQDSIGLYEYDKLFQLIITQDSTWVNVLTF